MNAVSGVSLIFILFLGSLISPNPAMAQEKPWELNLQRAIELALNNSKELRNGRFAVSDAELRRRLSLQSYFPSLSVQFSNLDSVIFGGVDSRQKNMAFTLSQPLYQGGRLKIERKIKGVEIQQSKHQLFVKHSEIRLGSYSAYFTYLIQEIKITLQERVLLMAEEQLKISQREYELGLLREVDLLETKGEVQAMAQSLVMQKLAFDEADFQLRKLLGLELQEEFIIKEELPSQYSGTDLFSEHGEELLEQAVNNNDQVRSSLFALEQSSLQYQSVKNRWKPNITMEGSLTFLGESYPLQNFNGSLSFNIEFPLPFMTVEGSFTMQTAPSRTLSNSTRSQGSGPKDLGFLGDITMSKQALANALQDLEDLQKDLRFQILSQNNRYQSMIQSLNMSRDQVSLQKQRLLILSKEVEIGSSTRLDYVSAQNKYVEQELRLLENTLELMITERSLESLLGMPFGALSSEENKESL